MNIESYRLEFAREDYHFTVGYHKEYRLVAPNNEMIKSIMHRFQHNKGFYLELVCDEEVNTVLVTDFEIKKFSPGAFDKPALLCIFTLKVDKAIGEEN